MNEPWNLRLLGGLRVERRERAITRFRTQKTAALLAYLAYHRHRSHSRESLIGLFWPEAEAESGRHSLSLALSSLRSQLEPPGVPAGGVVVADRWSVELNPDAFTTDVAAFEHALRAAAQTRDDRERGETLSQALAVYAGPLLPGFYEDWCLLERQRLEERFLQAVRQRIALAEKAGERSAALELARQAVAVDPLREELNAELMRLLEESGQAAAALRQFRDFERRLEQELGATPGAALRQRARALERLAEAAPEPAPVPPPLRLAPRAAAAPALPRGTVTFLLTDIEGSTAQWERAGEPFRHALGVHHALLRREFHRHGGHEVKESGDGFLVAFSGVGDALACAVAAQRGLTAQPWDDETGALKVRMAVYSGDVEEEDGDYHGLTLHRASRVLSAAHGGQVLCSEASAALLRRDLETEVRLRDLGLWRLRDVELPERIYQVEASGLTDAAFPALRADRAQVANLPIQFTRFFGRGDELAQLQTLLADPSVGLVTLTGPGGTGKTRLSVEAARRQVEALSGAVWFVPLADVEEPGLLVDALLDGLGLPRTGGDAPEARVVAHLAAQPSLLVLDNLEQIAEPAADLIQRLLERTPGLTCLATSRQLLGLPGEREFPVAPLPTPGDGGTPERLGVFESVRLFVDRAQAVKPDFQVTNANAPAVAALCNRLEGIPLAIELAAARAQVLTPAQMLAQLDNRFDLLVSRKRGVAERQRTLRAAIDWSFRLLSPELQRFFCRLCVFRGGWTVDAAEAVCDEPLALDLLAQLREGSLVVTEDGAAEMRFRMLETLRDYACERLGDDERAEARARHADHYRALAERAEPELRGEGQALWLDRLDEEHDNIRAAFDALRGDDGLEAALRLGAATWYFRSIRGYVTEGRRTLDGLLARASEGVAEALRARVLAGAGALALDQGARADAERHLEASVALWRRLGDPAGLAAALNLRANVALEGDEPARARACYEEALSLFRALDDRRGASIVLSNLGVLASDEGALDDAARRLAESIALKRALGNRYGLANSLDSLGSVEARRGDVPAARALYEEALAIRRAIRHRQGIALSCNNLGHLALSSHDLASARARFAESLPLLVEVDDPTGLAECLAGVAALPESAAHTKRLAVVSAESVALAQRILGGESA